MSPYKRILILLFVFLNASISAATLKWKFEPQDRLEVVKTAEIAYLINKSIQSQYYERNIVDLTCLDIKGKEHRVHGTFSVFTKQANDAAFQLTSRHQSDFGILESGRYVVPGKQIMPNLRHIPQFPEKELKKGDTWSAEGQLVLDNFSVPFAISMPVTYGITEITKDETSHTATIVYTYSIDNYIQAGSAPQDFPRRIVGKDEGILLWDLKNNRPIQFKNSYHIVMLFPTADQKFASHEWIMNITTDHTLYPHQKTAPAVEETIEDLPQNEGVTVSENDRGIVIRLGEVLFDFDSAKITEKTESALKNILSLIKQKYPDREIIVEGHTDNTGNPHYNQQLSERRADNIASRIVKDLDHDKVSYIGKGESEPIAPNNTQEGRKQNRRVDIIIKMK